jgi:hypothetical protein
VASLKSLITHGYITTLPKEEALSKGLYARINLHIGPGDEHYFSGVEYKKVGKEYVFTCGAVASIAGSTVHIPTFSNALCKEITDLCALYFDNVKRMGKFEYNKKYRVTTSNAVEIKDGE